jgi:hypothetical protein
LAANAAWNKVFDVTTAQMLRQTVNFRWITLYSFVVAGCKNKTFPVSRMYPVQLTAILTPTSNWGNNISSSTTGS